MTSRASGLALLGLLVLGLALRLPSAGSPPLDAHHVRQCDTASIARTFAREGIDLLHPRVDWAGPGGGTVESELPLYAAATALGWKVLGPVDARGGAPAVWARGLSIAGWMLGGFALFAWVRRRVAAPPWLCLALYAVSPLAILYSRNIQPDALAVGLLLWGLERVDAAAGEGSRGAAVLGGVLLGVAVAAKASVAFWLAPLLFVVGEGAARRRAWLASALGMLLPVAWYLHAHRLGGDGASFGIWGAEAHKWGGPGLWLAPATWRALSGSAVVAALTPVGAAAAAWGLLLARERAELRPFAAGLLATVAGVVVATEGFLLHSYYLLPAIPFASVLAGAAVHGAWERRSPRWVAALGALLLGLSVVLGGSFLREGLRLDRSVLEPVRTADLVLPSPGPLVVVDRHPQTLLYLLDRRGWVRSTPSQTELLEFEALGARVVLITDRASAQLDPEALSALRALRPELARADGWVALRLFGDRLF